MIDHLKTYHDATLERVELCWQSGRLTLTFASGRSTETIVVEEVEVLDCPRRQPWGRSTSVNYVRLKESVAGCVLEIEMQSGDLIVAKGQRVSVAEIQG